MLFLLFLAMASSFQSEVRFRENGLLGKAATATSAPGKRGYLIPVEEFGEEFANGCTLPPLSGAEKRLLRSIRWFAMVRGGGCSPDQKAVIVKGLGGSAVFVAKEGAAGFSGPARGEGEFPLVYVSLFFYRYMLQLFFSKGGSSLGDIAREFGRKEARAPLPFPIVNVDGGRGHMDNPLVQIAYVAFLILMIFLFPIIFHKLDEYESTQARPVVNPEELFAIKTCMVADLAFRRTFEKCSICLDEFSKEALVRPLPCEHYFHVECIDPWLLQRSNRCPICKAEVSGDAAARERPRGPTAVSFQELPAELQQQTT